VSGGAFREIGGRGEEEGRLKRRSHVGPSHIQPPLANPFLGEKKPRGLLHHPRLSPSFSLEVQFPKSQLRH